MFKALRSYFLSGLLVLVPGVITVWVLIKFVAFVETRLGAYFVMFLKWAGLPVFPGYGIVSVLLLVMTAGLLTRLYVGRMFISAGDRFFGKLPVVSGIYRLIKQIIDAFFKGDKRIFERVVLVEFPRKGVYTFGFVTSHTQGLVAEKIEGTAGQGRSYLNVFVVHVPNPTTGFYLIYPEDEVIATDMSFETAMKVMMSFGAFMPEGAKVSAPPSPR